MHPIEAKYREWWVGKRCRNNQSLKPCRLVTDLQVSGPPSLFVCVVTLVYDDGTREIVSMGEANRPRKSDVIIETESVVSGAWPLVTCDSRLLWTEPEQRVLIGDCREGLRSLPEKSVQFCCCSPPYWSQRLYGTSPQKWSEGDWTGELGNEPTPQLFIAHLCEVFSEIWRVLRDDAVLAVNLGDTHAAQRGGTHPPAETLAGGKHGRTAEGETVNRGRNPGYNAHRNASAIGLKHKDLCLIPYRFAIAMQDAGWYVRSILPWIKRNSMPDSATDRPGQAVEYVLLFTKKPNYFWDHIAVMQKGSGKGGGASFGKQLDSSDGTGAASRRLESVTERSEIDGMRNFRNSDLFFSSMENPPYGLVSAEDGIPLALDVNPKSFHGSHFAVMPELLVEPLLLAATSAAGCCAECGTPWNRVSEKKIKVHDKWYGNKHGDAGRNSRGSAGASYREVVGIHTAGWEPGCKCGAETAPCTILDPFGGSGTSLVVAKTHGRRGIACELNPEYIPLMQSRLNGVSARKEKENPAQGSLGLECA